jgi:hypothetical protein
MSALANLFSFSPLYAFFSVGIAAFAGFILGYLLKSGIIAKHKKRVMSLENEMLSNHARILNLEKENAQLRSEKLVIKSTPMTSSKVELRAS